MTDNFSLSRPLTNVIHGQPKGKKASRKLKWKGSLDLQFEETIEKFDFRSPKPSEVQCSVQRVGYLTFENGRLTFPDDDTVRKFRFCEPKLPLRLNYYKRLKPNFHLKWTHMETILGHFELKISEFDFIGRSSAIKRIGSRSSSLDTKFTRILGHKTMYCEIMKKVTNINLGDFGYQFENACTPHAPLGKDLYLATINEFRIRNENRYRVLMIHEIDAVDDDLNPVEIKASLRAFKGKLISSELQCAFADMKCTYVAKSITAQAPLHYMVITDIEKKEMKPLARRCLIGWNRIIAVLEHIEPIVKKLQACNQFQLLSMGGKFVFGGTKDYLPGPLILTAETLQLFPTFMPPTLPPKQRKNKTKNRRKRARGNKRRGEFYAPPTYPVQIDYFPEERPAPTKKIRHDMSWMDELPTKSLWDGK